MKKTSSYICIVFIAFFLGAVTPVVAQDNYYQIAEQFFNQGDFEQAADYYLKTYKKSNSIGHFDKYVLALSSGKDFKTAEKALKKEIKKRPNRFALRVTLGDVYWQSGNKSAADKAWKEIIELLPSHQQEIVPVAFLLAKVNQPRYAIQAYEVGKKYVKGFYSYYFQMAELYGLIGDYGNMIDLYLELININSGYLQTVQNMLNRNFDFTEPNTNTQLLKQKLLQKTNQHPEQNLYAEMLIWLNLQESNFAGAFIQVKSLDKRFKENGSRLVNFARLAHKNKAYEIAKSSYTIVIGKGTDLPYYEIAKVEILTTAKMELDTEINPELKRYENLVSEYLSTLEELTITDYTAPSVRQMGQIYAQKLNQSEQALSWLGKVLNTPGVSNKEQALTKIDLGDYLVMENKIWEGVLYYMQAEKAFKYDELGDVAKLRAAKVAYYTGDFSWAAAKLNVLKGSTSKLISNDALYLSNLITDNSTVDTNLHPLQLYAKADLLFVQKSFTSSLATLDSLQEFYPDHMLADEVLYQKYKIFKAQGKFKEAAAQLETLYAGYGYDILADDALFSLGELYQYYLNDTALAMEYYLEILTNFPDSVFVTDARARYRKLRGDSV